MKILLDTHLLVWLAAQTSRLPVSARAVVEDPKASLFFSSASLWELMIKRALGRGGIPVHPRVLHGALLENEFHELAVTSAHALQTQHLPLIHKDPFDRILIVQAKAEGMVLVTSDETVGLYGEPVWLAR
jgi:PIN domain nuclease of toxin-antitoxin system